MSAIAEWKPKGMADAGAGTPAWSVAATTPEAIADEWRQLEGSGLATPYQRLGWVSAYARHALAADGATLKVVAVRDPHGRLIAILPFAVKRLGPTRTASFVGGKHANFHMALFERSFAARLAPADARRLLADAARAMDGVDAFVLLNQPVSWDGVANPLARLSPQPSPSQAYRLSLGEDCEATLAAKRSAESRKKQKKKRQRLAGMGALRSYIAETQGDVDRVLAAFHKQKALRFAELGLPDPFGAEPVRDFLAAASRRDGPPVLSLAALDLDGRVIATFIGAVNGRRWSGMATSFAPDAELMKSSPGEIVLHDMVQLEHARGIRVIDLGVGEATYKAHLCDETEELVDSFVPVSLTGRLIAGLARSGQSAKAAIKRSPVALALASKVLALRPRP